MRRAVAIGQRHAGVRAAAREWRAVGWIGDSAEREISLLFPDDRRRQRPALRVLLWIFTVFAASGAFGFWGALVPGNPWGPLTVIAAAACTALVELQHGRLRLAEFGTESATSWLALAYAIGAVAWFTELGRITGETRWVAVMAAGTSVLAFLAGWRWGSPLQLGLGLAAFFVWLAQMPFARWSWITAGLVLLPLLDRWAVAPRWAPSHRRGALVMWMVAAAALGLALHPSTELATRPDAGELPPPIAWAAFTGFCVALLAAGLRGRRRWALDLGTLATGVLVVTVLVEVEARPLWLVLTVAGTALAALALGLRRLLDAGPNGERRGVTARAVLAADDRASALEIPATIALATPGPRAEPPERPLGGGGSFGGGGASTQWSIWIVVLAAAGALACSRAEGPREKPLETVEVAPPPDASASMAEDPQSKAIGQGFSGVLPPDFPKDFPLAPDWSLASSARGGRRSVTLRIPTAVAATRERVAMLLRPAGWQPVDGDDGHWRSGEREIRLTFTPADKATMVRVEY